MLTLVLLQSAVANQQWYSFALTVAKYSSSGIIFDWQWEFLRAFYCTNMSQKSSNVLEDVLQPILITGADTEEANTIGDAREFALIGVTFELTLEDKIRVLSIELENASNLLKHSKRINANFENAKKDLQTKLDNHLVQIEKWRNSSKNLFRLIDSSMFVRTKVGLGFNDCIRENELGWDDSAFSVFTTNSEDVEGRLIFQSDKSLEVNTNDFASNDSSVNSLEHKLTDSTSCASTSSISTSEKEAEIESNFVPQAVLLRTGKVHILTGIPQPVPTGKLKVTPVPTGKPKVKPVLTGIDRQLLLSPQQVVLGKHIEKVYNKYPRTIVDLIHLHTDNNVADLLTKALDGPRTKELASHEQTATGKDISNSFLAMMVCQKSLGYSNSPLIHVLRVRLVINSPRYIVSTGRVIVPTSRYVVPTGRVIVATGRYIVPAGNVL
nr:late embryogenesis abundant protein, LEA-14 [Tanacetum cinerariifolium]